MSIVKITNKQQLDELVVKLTMRMGRKPTQQEELDLCVRLGSENFEEIVQRLEPTPKINEEKIQKIRTMQKELSKIKWYPPKEEEYPTEEDKLIYGG